MPIKKVVYDETSLEIPIPPNPGVVTFTMNSITEGVRVTVKTPAETWALCAFIWKNGKLILKLISDVNDPFIKTDDFGQIELEV